MTIAAGDLKELDVDRGRSRSVGRRPRFVYMTEVDVSIENGRGINEREFVRALEKDYGAEVVCVLPRPAADASYVPSGAEYAFNHGQRSLRYAPHLVSMYRRIAALHRRRPIDALVVRLDATPILPYLVSRVLGVPIIHKTLAPYAPFHDDAEYRRSPQQVMNRTLRPMIRAVVDNAYFADTVSPSMARWIGETFELAPHRLRVIRNGANTEMFSPGKRQVHKRILGLNRFDFVLGYAGVLDEHRHLDAVVRSIAELNQHMNVGFVLLGSGRGREKLERLAGNLGIGRQVVFTGSIPYTRVPEFIRAFDLGIDLSLITLDCHGVPVASSFSQKVAQYLACGVPVVTWRVPDNAFLAENGVGITVPLGRRDALAGALHQFLAREPGWRDAVAAKARAYAVEHLAIERLTEDRVRAWVASVQSSLAVAARD